MGTYAAASASLMNKSTALQSRKKLMANQGNCNQIRSDATNEVSYKTYKHYKFPHFFDKLGKNVEGRHATKY